MILEKIRKPNDIHKIPLADFEPLAEEIRDFLIQSVSTNRRSSCLESRSGGADPGTA